MAITAIGPMRPNATRVIFRFEGDETYNVSGLVSTDENISRSLTVIYSPDEKYKVINKRGTTEADTLTLNFSVIHNSILNRLKKAFNSQEEFKVAFTDARQNDHVKYFSGIVTSDIFQLGITDDDNATFVVSLAGKFEPNTSKADCQKLTPKEK